MSIIDAARYRLRVLLHPDRYGDQLQSEIEHHLELEAMEQGGTPADARRRAMREFGNVTYSNEERRLVSGVAILDALRQDVQFVLRVLRRRRVFAAVTVATLALGVGAATSIFSVADIVLFRSLPFPDPGRLITVWQTHPEVRNIPGRSAQWDRAGISLPMYRNWRAAQNSFTEIAAWATMSTIVGGTDAPEELPIIRASSSLLPVLGIRPEAGRNFAAEDDDVGGAPVMLVSHEAWISRLGSDPHILGRRVQLDSVSYSVIGVLPPGIVLQRGLSVPYWIPIGGARGAMQQDVWAIGRIKTNVSLPAAAAETERLFRDSPDNDSPNHGVRLMPLQDEQTRKVRQPILILLAAAGVLLLIACVNVATVLMGEAATRETELRARAALGASRGRLVRQLLTESLVLSAIGGALGTLLAYGGTKAIVRLAPRSIPGLSDIRVDARVLAVSLAVSCLTGLIFGLVPALALSRANDGTGLRLGSQSARGRGRSQRALVACEVALSMVLLVGAGLLLRSFEKITAIDPGFRPEHLLVASIRLPQPQWSDSTRARQLFSDLITGVRALPGVTNVAITSVPPFSGGSSSSSFQIEGRTVSAGDKQPDAQRRITTPDFFSTAGIPLVDGRFYTDADRGGDPLVVVVSRSLAQREWPNESAVAKRIKWMSQWRTIVGVVGDIKLHDLAEGALPTVFTPLGQLYRNGGDPSLVVRTAGDVSDLPASIQRIVRTLAPGVPIQRMETMTSMVAATLADQRFRTQLMSVFASLAALLAAVGMYGVAATAASRRTQEMAIRSALGAPSGSIARLIVGAGAGGVVVGAVAGVGLALLGTRALAPYLYGVGTTDPATFVGVLVLLGFTTLAATWIPARRAMRVPLVDTLRGE